MVSSSPPPRHDITADRQFISWLAHHHISIACTTYQTSRLMLLGVNPETHEISGFERIFDRAMGLYATPERLYLSSKYQLWQLDNALTPGQLHNGYDKLYIPRIGYTTGDIDVHDITLTHAPRSQLLFISTLLNCIATVSDRHSCIPLWKPPFISRIINEDRCHLNGLALREGQARYVTAVSRSDIIDGWRDRRWDGGIVMDITSNDILAQGLSMPHSPRWYRDRLWLLNSGRGELGYVDLKTGEFEAIAFCPGYLRGLSFWQNYAIVGLSQPRHGDKAFSGLPLDDLLRAKDAEPRCGLMVINLNTGAIEHWLRFEGVITELYDVQIIPGAQRPMALGFQTEEIAQMITLPPEASLQAFGKQIIAFSLWGAHPKYTTGALKNADLAPEIYPGWICRFYVDQTVPQDIVTQLQSRPWVEVVRLDGDLGWKLAFARFSPAADPDVAVFISRDTDSRLNLREKAAVEAWLASPYKYHIMRDHPRHNVPILAGMWGVKGNLPDLQGLIQEHLIEHQALGLKYGIDQHFLATKIYPKAIKSGLIHDEIFGHTPFPTPRNSLEYVGQVFLEDDSTLIPIDELLKQHLENPEVLTLQTLELGPTPGQQQKMPQISPSVQALFDRSRLLKQQNKLIEAETCLREVIDLQPSYWPAYNNLGTLLQNNGALEAAKDCYQQAIQLYPNFAEAISNLASIWQLEERLEEAKTGFHQAIALKPDYLPAHLNLANIYRQQRRMAAAIEHYQKVLTLDPLKTEAYFSLGQIFEYQGKVEEALNCYQQALKADPKAHYLDFFINLVNLRLCHWQDYDQQVQTMCQNLEASFTDTFSPNPFVLSTFDFPLALHEMAAVHQAKTMERAVKAEQRPVFDHHRHPVSHLHIGYISPDFRDHAVGRLIAQLFHYHDRDRYRVYAYTTVDVEDEITRQIQQGCDVFVDLSALSTVAAAQRIDADGIHILIDLAGYTIGNGAAILALQPAPIQAQWLGYPDTLGASWMQYAIADSWLITPDIAAYYHEKIVYLPHAFVGSPLAISQRPMTRSEFGLPDAGFVFCCFNSHYKITPQLFDAWMRILQQVPDSVLWLLAGPDTATENLRREADQRGIQPDRLIFASKIDHPDYLARYRLADLYLDTFVYNAGSTAIAAIWAGLPLLTHPGQTNASRMGASICAAAGLEAFICSSVQAYEDQAIYLGTHPQELAIRRQDLQQRLAVEGDRPPLFQVEAFVRHLEKALEQMWQAN